MCFHVHIFKWIFKNNSTMYFYITGSLCNCFFITSRCHILYIHMLAYVSLSQNMFRVWSNMCTWYHEHICSKIGQSFLNIKYNEHHLQFGSSYPIPRFKKFNIWANKVIAVQGECRIQNIRYYWCCKSS